MKYILSLMAVTLLYCFTVSANGHRGAKGFIRVSDGHLYKPGYESPYYFIGTNMWYAPILASKGQGGNRKRLKKELDALQKMGVENLRILVGAETGSANANTVYPVLQNNEGELNDTLLDGLDYLLREMEKRNMTGVFYLNNAWDWSGGYSFYLKQAGLPDSPCAAGDGYNDYVKYAANFSLNEQAQKLFLNYIRKIVTRRNRYTGKAYKDSPAIMAWQICNEPRPFSNEAKQGFARWLSQAAAIIKEADPNHLVSTGSEGYYGCATDMTLCEEIHNDPNIDYITLHIWPVNWQWSSRGSLYASLPNVYVKASEYIEMHEHFAQKSGKPIIIEEFGYPRERNKYQPGSNTLSRDAFYNFIFGKVQESKQQKGIIAGCNFWGWGGYGRPTEEVWKTGYDYICDPPHEPQGWYSVFDCDTTTTDIITKAVSSLR